MRRRKNARRMVDELEEKRAAASRAGQRMVEQELADTIYHLQRQIERETGQWYAPDRCGRGR